MMSGWLHYLKLQTQARTGLSEPVIAWALLAAVCGAVTFGFIVLTAGILLTDRYGPLAAALILGAFFLLVTIIAIIACVIGHRRAVAQASHALTVRSNAPWVNPQTLALGVQIGRAIGWRRLLPLIAVGIIAAGLTKEWVDKPTRQHSADDEPHSTS